MSKVKKFLIFLIVFAVLSGTAVVGLCYLKRTNYNKKKVDVYSVSELSTDASMFGSYSENYGIVNTALEQKIRVSKTQKISEIRVEEGDQVKAGDVLAVYDVKDKELNIEIQRTALEVKRARIQSAKYDLDLLNNTIPVEETTETTDTTEILSEELSEDVSTLSEVEEQIDKINDENGCISAFSNTVINNSLNIINNEKILREDEEDDYISSTESDDTTEDKSSDQSENTTEDKSRDESENTTEKQSNDESNNISGDNPNANPDGDIPDKKQEKYTEKELEEAIKNKEQEISRLELEYELAVIDFQILEHQTSNGEVYCNFNGIVKSVISEEEALESGEPIIVVGTEEGYVVQATIGELDLIHVKSGDEVSLECYENGMTYTGKVTSISDLPTDAMGYNYDGSVQSYYPITICIQEADELRQGMGMNIKYNGKISETLNNIYLRMPFVRKEGGRYYVMKSVDGVLKKQYVSTGKVLYNEYIEILDGLTRDDEVAFPFSSEAEEGVQTETKSFDESMMY
ncbi:MAG: HlyD family efflux transporter periplasmic adaptor subunit [Lachnospiraceae bacterium]|nr:HlyD family efflux transporter periplasmic adaptor subunit [Lachnospiraceae bacterium]